MRNASILVKLVTAALSIIFAGVVGLVLFGLMMHNTIDNMEDMYYEELYSVNDKVLSADRELYKAALINKEYVDEATKESPNADIIAEQKSSFAAAVGSAYSSVKAIEKVMVNYPDLGEYSYEGTDINGCIDKFETDFMSWKAMADPSKASTVSNFENATALFPSVSEPVNMMGTIVEQFVDEETDDYTDKVRGKMIALYVTMGIIMIVTIVYTVIVIRYIRNSLNAVSYSFLAIAGNDLSGEIKEIHTKDEIGALNKAARDVQGHLREVVGSLKKSSVMLADSSREMGVSTKQASDSMGNINEAATELARTATGQAEDISNISTHMKTIGEMMSSNTSNAASLAAVSDEIRDITDEGTRRVNGLKNVTEQSVEAFEYIFQLISGIEQSTEKISEASDLISSIADQTNLLSLNASIEAARAGDAGKGFAVVADEIRNLSEQSAESVNTINDMLADLQSRTTDASKQSDNVRDCVNRQKEAVDETSQSFMDIAEGIQKINATVDEFHGANNNLSDGIGNISSLINRLADNAEQNAATAEELNATTDTVSESVGMLITNGQNVSSSAEELEKIIAEFQL